MGKALAIKGHSTRGKEVIELLEMLGGSNKNNLSGNHSCAYYVNGHQNIIQGIDYIFGYEDMQFFSIERFLEKYPFKVGDKVHIYVQNDDIDGRYDLEVAEITSMRWDPVRCKIAYKMKDINREFFKEEIKCKVDDNLIKTTKVMRNTQESLLKKNSITISSLCYEDEVELNFGCEYELIERDGKHILIKKKPKYPKTYKECCDVLGIDTMDNDAKGYKHFLLIQFQELIIARDAYWKIAGEQMGLDKPWEPKNELSTRNKIYDIRTYCSAIEKGCTEYPTNRLLSFPTEEMRDAFYNNFKELIERCKELL